MSFSSNRYGALDHLFDLDLAMATNGFNSNGGNNPASLSYSPETASLLATGVYNPTGAARSGSTELSSATNGVFHHHHSTNNSSNHHSLLTPNSNSPAPSTQAYVSGAGQYSFGGTNNYNNSRGMSPYGGAPSTSAAAAAAANTALQQMAAAAFEPIPIRQQAARAQQRHQNDHERSPLEEFLLMGNSAFMNPSTAASFPVQSASNAFDHLSMHHDSFQGRNGQNNDHSDQFQEEEWMKEISLQVPSLSLEPISGMEVVRRIKSCTADVIRRYIPCVDFLVQCQQELRKGLAAAQPKQTGRRYRQASMTPRQFWQSYIENLPHRFYLTNERRMEHKALQDAMDGLQKLRSDAKEAVNQGCEAVKNSFLGGMKEGESWGLRKWLSKNGNALRVCTDMECILRACKELDKSKDSTKKLAACLRPLAKETLDRLKKDVPPSYQERSTAHPYLPFFHRLEGALRNMSQFDPEDDGIICLDDSDDDDDDPVVVEPPPPPKRKPPARKRKAAETHAIETASPQKRVFVEEPETGYNGINQNDLFVTAPATATNSPDDGSSSGESDVDSVIEIVGALNDETIALGTRVEGEQTEWRCTNCSVRNPASSGGVCQGCGEPSYNTDLVGTLFSNSYDDRFGEDLDMNSVDRGANGFTEPIKAKSKKSSKRQACVAGDISHRFPVQVSMEELNAAIGVAQSLAAKAERLASIIESPNSDKPVQMVRARKSPSLWDDLYGRALRIFSDVLRQPDAIHFVEPIDEFDLMKAGHPSYSSVVKNPLCFRDILATLIDLEHMDEAHNGCYRWFNGILPRRSLSQWNMWRGSDLLQAVDLVFLNSLAYGKICGEGRSRHRSRTNDLRKQLWNQIHETVSQHIDDAEQRRHNTPTRRSETSGFVVHKAKGR